MIRTRFAPSPTGDLHIGGLRTALYSFALAKHSGGEFILRIEDTDKKREVKGAREKMESILADFGLKWDEKYVQSERLDKYKQAAEKLVKEGNAFYCDCKPKNAKKQGYSKELRDECRDKGLTVGAIKLKVPEAQGIGYRDFVIGKKISWSTNDVNDATLLKSDGFPTYHLAVVVDDNDMGITHALRGYDWLPSTPIHLLVYKYLGLEPPIMGHLTDILDPDGGKLSKRKGSVSVESFLKGGYLSEALLNFVMLLGWAPKDDREFFSLDEFVKKFDENGFHKSNPIFNRDKLDWMNGEYIRKTENSKLKTQIKILFGGEYGDELVAKLIPLVKTRMKTLDGFGELCEFIIKEPKVDKKLLGDNYKEHLGIAMEVIEKNGDLEKEAKAKDFHIGKFFMDLRIALAGKKITPPINESIEILGKDKVLERIRKLL